MSETPSTIDNRAEAEVSAVPDDFSFPYTPYSIQKDFMRELYETLETGKVGIFESPTGTGKSLSLLCSSVTWLLANEHRVRAELQQRVERLCEQMEKLSADDDWVTAQNQIMSLEREKNEVVDQQEKLKAFDEKMRLMHARASKDLIIQKKQLKRKDAPSGEDQENREIQDYLSSLNGQDKSDDVDSDIAPSEFDPDKKSPSQSSPRKTEPEETVSCQKIFFASRTHSQLDQFLREIQKTQFVKRDHLRVVIKSKFTERIHHLIRKVLGSRKQLCVNESVLALGQMALINDRCQQMLNAPSKGDKTCKLDVEDTVTAHRTQKGKSCGKCAYNGQDQVNDLGEQMLKRVRPTEQIVKLGRHMKACSYYAARKALPNAQLVLLPYQILLSASSRAAWGIQLEGNVLIIDEAHNLLDAVAATHSTELTQTQVANALCQLECYMVRFRTRLAALNLMFVQQLRALLLRLGAVMDKATANGLMQDITQFTLAAQIEDMNLYKLLDYIERSDICRKLFGFSNRYPTINTEVDKQQTTVVEKKVLCDHCTRTKLSGIKRLLNKNSTDQSECTCSQSEPASTPANHRSVPSGSPMFQVKSFIEALCARNEDGRLLVASKDGQASVRFVLLNTGSRLVPLVRQAHSVILAGGTMKPADELLHALHNVCDMPHNRLHTFTCSHVIPPNQLSALCIGVSTANRPLRFTFEHRSTAQTMTDLAGTVERLCGRVKGGCVLFWPSYDYMNKVCNYWKHNGLYKQLEGLGKLLVEPRESAKVSECLNEFGRAVATQPRAILSAVVGGKMSEGINFSDDLGRCVIVIGLPYANKTSPELVEKMKYLDAQSQSSGVRVGQLYYENQCLRAVNQSIGRAIRHANDHALIVLLDQRLGEDVSIMNTVLHGNDGE